jgi:hypothetical protein
MIRTIIVFTASVTCPSGYNRVLLTAPVRGLRGVAGRNPQPESRRHQAQLTLRTRSNSKRSFTVA